MSDKTNTASNTTTNKNSSHNATGEHPPNHSKPRRFRTDWRPTTRHSAPPPSRRRPGPPLQSVKSDDYLYIDEYPVYIPSPQQLAELSDSYVPRSALILKGPGRGKSSGGRDTVPSHANSSRDNTSHERVSTTNSSGPTLYTFEDALRPAPTSNISSGRASSNPDVGSGASCSEPNSALFDVPQPAVDSIPVQHSFSSSLLPPPASVPERVDGCGEQTVAVLGPSSPDLSGPTHPALPGSSEPPIHDRLGPNVQHSVEPGIELTSIQRAVARIASPPDDSQPECDAQPCADDGTVVPIQSSDYYAQPGRDGVSTYIPLHHGRPASGERPVALPSINQQHSTAVDSRTLLDPVQHTNSSLLQIGSDRGYGTGLLTHAPAGRGGSPPPDRDPPNPGDVPDAEGPDDIPDEPSEIRAGHVAIPYLVPRLPPISTFLGDYELPQPGTYFRSAITRHRRALEMELPKHGESFFNFTQCIPASLLAICTLGGFPLARFIDSLFPKPSLYELAAASSLAVLDSDDLVGDIESHDEFGKRSAEYEISALDRRVAKLPDNALHATGSGFTHLLRQSMGLLHNTTPTATGDIIPLPGPKRTRRKLTYAAYLAYRFKASMQDLPKRTEANRRIAEQWIRKFCEERYVRACDIARHLPIAVELVFVPRAVNVDAAALVSTNIVRERYADYAQFHRDWAAE